MSRVGSVPLSHRRVRQDLWIAHSLKETVYTDVTKLLPFRAWSVNTKPFLHPCAARSSAWHSLSPCLDPTISLLQSPRRFLSFSVPLSKHSYCILTFFSMCSLQLLVLNEDSLSPKAAPFSQQLCQVESIFSLIHYMKKLCVLVTSLCYFWTDSSALFENPQLLWG